MGVRWLFWDVDTQHDFMDEDGKLPVPGARAIADNLSALSRFALEHRIPVVASADAHTPDDPEFAQFGRHCVAGTPGQAKVDETALPGREVADPGRLEGQAQALAGGDLPQLVIEKQDLDVFTVPAADDLLSALRPERVVVYGVTTEYCVRQAALGIRKRGCPVVVVTDAVKAIDEQAGRQALAEMRAAGVGMMDTGKVLDLVRLDAEA